MRYTADIRTLFAVTLYFVVLAVGFAQEFSWVTFAFAVPLAWLAFTCAVITHNTIHTPVFKSKTANRIFQIILTLSYGHPVSAYVPGHNLSHHMHTQSPKDVMRTTKARFRWNFLNQLLFVFVVGPAIAKADKEYVQAMRKKRPVWFRQWVIEFAAMFIVTGGLLVLDWRKALILYIVPHFFAAWGIIGINFAQHDGCDENHPYNHSRNFTGYIINFLLFNNGFHGIHHDKPNMHWSLLRDAHNELISPHIHPNLEQKSLFGYLFRTHIWPGKRLDYLGNPVVLPDPVPDESWVPRKKELGDVLAHGAVEN